MFGALSLCLKVNKTVSAPWAKLTAAQLGSGGGGGGGGVIQMYSVPQRGVLFIKAHILRYTSVLLLQYICVHFPRALVQVHSSPEHKISHGQKKKKSGEKKNVQNVGVFCTQL